MTTQADRLATPLPQRLRTRPRDRRFYPIPFIVLIDAKGQPQFTINDDAKLRACISKRLCGLCGKRFDRYPGVASPALAYWFVGGPRCFTDVNGAFVDPPMHYDCAAYALRVCPFLAARHYGRWLGEAKLSASARPADAIIIDNPMVSDTRPDCFGLGGTLAYRVVATAPSERVFVVDQWMFVEFWRGGQIVNAPALAAGAS